MKQRKQDRIDLLQNIGIVCLIGMALLQFMGTQKWNLPAGFSLLSGNAYLQGAVFETDAGDDLTDLAAPLRAAVSGKYGRHGSIALTTEDSVFVPLGELLRDAIDTTGTIAECDEQIWVDELIDNSVYYDFLHPLPLSIISGLVGADDAHMTDSIAASNVNINADAVRYLLLSAHTEESASLLFWDGGKNYYYCSTALSRAELESAVENVARELNRLRFAFEWNLNSSTSFNTSTGTNTSASTDTGNNGSLWALLPEKLPELPSLKISRSLSNRNQILSTLGFNSRTRARYRETDGTEAIIDGERVLRISGDGKEISCQNIGSLSHAASSTGTPNLSEAVRKTIALLKMLHPDAGDGHFYLSGVSSDKNQDVTREPSTARPQTENLSVTLRFDYHLNGVPVSFSDGASAAEVTLSGAELFITDLRLRFRQYSYSSLYKPLLPQRQAIAVAKGKQGHSLVIGYADRGGDYANVVWLTD